MRLNRCCALTFEHTHKCTTNSSNKSNYVCLCVSVWVNEREKVWKRTETIGHSLGRIFLKYLAITFNGECVLNVEKVSAKKLPTCNLIRVSSGRNDSAVHTQHNPAHSMPVFIQFNQKIIKLFETIVKCASRSPGIASKIGFAIA